VCCEILGLGVAGRIVVRRFARAAVIMASLVAAGGSADVDEVAGAEQRASEAVVVGGVAFIATSPATWRIPQPDSQTVLTLALHMTNRTDSDLRFNLMDSAVIELNSVKGRSLRSFTVHHAARAAPLVAPLLHPGETYLFEFAAELEPSGNDGTPRLQWVDPSGAIGFIEGLEAGDYGLSFRYSNSLSRAGEFDRIWTGDAEAGPLRVEIVR